MRRSNSARLKTALRLSALALTACMSATAWGQSWTPPAPPAAPPTKAQIDEAKDRYQKGIKLYEEDGVVDAALGELERSYELAPNYKVLYNIGQVARSLPDYVTALRAYEKYLADGGKEIPDKRKAEVDKEIASLRDRVAYLEIAANQDGASVSIDDIVIGKTPLREAVMVNPGRRKILVSKDGLTATQTVTVVGKDRLRLQLDLTDTKSAPTATPAATGGPTSAATSTAAPSGTQAALPPVQEGSSYTWIGWVAAGACAVGAGVTGGLAIGASKDLERTAYARTPADAQNKAIPDDVKSKQASVQTMAVLSDVLIGATVVSLGATIIAVARGKSASPPSPAGATGRASALEVRVLPGGVAVRGNF